MHNFIRKHHEAICKCTSKMRLDDMYSALVIYTKERVNLYSEILTQKIDNHLDVLQDRNTADKHKMYKENEKLMSLLQPSETVVESKTFGYYVETYALKIWKPTLVFIANLLDRINKYTTKEIENDNTLDQELLPVSIIPITEVATVECAETASPKYDYDEYEEESEAQIILTKLSYGLTELIKFLRHFSLVSLIHGTTALTYTLNLFYQLFNLLVANLIITLNNSTLRLRAIRQRM